MPDDPVTPGRCLADVGWPTTRLLRYLFSGLTSLVLDLALLALLHGVVGLPAPIAAALAYTTVFLYNYALNRSWTFRSTGSAVAPELLRFSALAGAAAVVIFLGMGWLTGLGVPYLLAKVCLLAAIVPTNYLVLSRWVFLAPAESHHLG